MKRLKSFLPSLTVLALCLTLSGCPWDPDPVPAPEQVTGSKTISLSPIAQQTEVWCWAAVSEMVLRYYGLPNLNGAGNYQCGIVAAYYGPYSTCWQNCFTCVSTIAGMTEMNKIVTQYGSVANNLGVPSRNLTSSLVFRALTLKEIADDINNDRPVIAGISPSGVALPNASQHVTLVVGYDATGPQPVLTVNDPYPFDYMGVSNPYTQVGAIQVQPGQYLITYSAFVTYLKWANSVYRIK